MSNDPREWFDQMVGPGDELLGGRRFSQAQRLRLESAFTVAFETVKNESRRQAYVGSSRVQGRYFFCYERLAEKTSYVMAKIARDDILPKLLHDS